MAVGIFNPIVPNPKVDILLMFFFLTKSSSGNSTLSQYLNFSSKVVSKTIAKTGAKKCYLPQQCLGNLVADVI